MGSIPTTSRRKWLTMADDILSEGDIDPEIANLLEGDPSSSSVPDFTDLFDEPGAMDEPRRPSEAPVEDLTRECFAPIDRWEQEPDPLFFEKNYYSDLLSGEGDISKRVHGLLQKYLKVEDPQERGVYRQRLIPCWWDLARGLSSSYMNGVEAKRMALRFGYVLPTLVSVEQRRMLSRVVKQNITGEPVHYVDEWLDMALAGDVNPLASDELRPSSMNQQTKTRARLEKAKGSKDANIAVVRNLIVSRDGFESDFESHVRSLLHHENHPSISGLKLPYTSDQRMAMSRINDLIRKLMKIDKDIRVNLERLKESDMELGKIGDKINQLGGLNKADKGTMEGELESIRQMAKLCVGRQGNHLPFLMKNFFFPNLDLIGTRENVIRYMDQVEQVDPGVFRRTFRQKTNRIVPHTLLIPCYGDKGVCWEPFERYNRATSRGRIAIPMFPKSLKLAVIYALGDLRWNVAKEKAQHYWMEEGLTGHYFQWFSSSKNRGDVRLQFLDDYVLWITKEVDGVQKLDKDVRGIFWRHISFTQPVKDTLRNRGFVYNELYKKDMNREISDGY